MDYQQQEINSPSTLGCHGHAWVIIPPSTVVVRPLQACPTGQRVPHLARSQHYHPFPSSSLGMSTEKNAEGESKTKLPFWLDIGTKGGAVFWSLVLFIVPIIGYNIVTGVFGYDEIEAGKWIGVGFTAIAMLAWSSTYLFRVATKDMTYAKQLKDYENAVIAKRLEELDDDEIQALVEEIERDEF